MKTNTPTIDIAFNITDKQIKHINSILLNCNKNKVIPILIGTNYEESIKCIEYSKKYNLLNYVGLHPTESNKFNDLIKIKELIKNNKENKIIGIGECGLDNERLHKASIETQIKAFEYQLREFRIYNLPYFFHSRNSTKCFINLFNKYNKLNLLEGKEPIKGVIHSFTDSLEDLNSFLNLGLFISFNGLTLNKDKENGYNLLLNIPLNKLLIETDSPYCKLKDKESSLIENHISFWNSLNLDYLNKKLLSSNEPSKVLDILYVISKIRNIDINLLKDILLKNFISLFNSLNKENLLDFFSLFN